MIKVVFNVQAPRSNVYAILTDYGGYKKWVPGCERCDVLSSTGNVTETQVVMNSAKRMELTLRFEAEPTQSLRFRMTKSRDLKGYSGTYRLMNAADQKGTVVIAELEIDAGFMAPKFMVDRMATKALQDTGEALNGYLKQAPPPAVAAPAGPRAEKEMKTRRNKQVLRVVKTQAGYRVWLLGEILDMAERGDKLRHP
jgi:ribosome-associated toxin RatA of RatAB toxin-antitoxin module